VGSTLRTESHCLRVTQALEKHLQTSFADILLLNANGGKGGIHQDSFRTIVRSPTG